MGLPDERALIEVLTSGLEPERNRAGFASDCAIVPLGDDELVASVDAFSEATHFPEGLPPARAGQLAAAAAMSDLAAAGAELLGVLTAYGVPARTDRSTIEGLAGGIAATVEAAGGEVLGGDTKPREELTATITALGTCPRGEAMTREAARPGQLVIVTGPLGGAGAALDRIREGLDPAQADPLVPTARVAAGRQLREHGVACAMDLSDGLAEAAVAIGQASDVQIRIEAEAVPLQAWARESDRGLAHALSTGGDYELAATIPEDDPEPLLAALRDEGLRPAIVGSVHRGEGARLQTPEGSQVLDRGYEHRFGEG